MIKVYPLAVYTADHGLAWSYPEAEIDFVSLDSCRKAFGSLPDFDAGGKGFDGVWANGDRVFVMKCQSVAAWDFRGRDATYLTVTWIPRSEAAEVDFDRLLHAEPMCVPSKNPPPFFEIDAARRTAARPTYAESVLYDGLARAGDVIATQPVVKRVAIKRLEGETQAICVISQTTASKMPPSCPPRRMASCNRGGDAVADIAWQKRNVRWCMMFWFMFAVWIVTLTGGLFIFSRWVEEARHNSSLLCQVEDWKARCFRAHSKCAVTNDAANVVKDQRKDGSDGSVSAKQTR